MSARSGVLAVLMLRALFPACLGILPDFSRASTVSSSCKKARATGPVSESCGWYLTGPGSKGARFKLLVPCSCSKTARAEAAAASLRSRPPARAFQPSHMCASEMPIDITSKIHVRSMFLNFNWNLKLSGKVRGRCPEFEVRCLKHKRSKKKKTYFTLI